MRYISEKIYLPERAVLELRWDPSGITRSLCCWKYISTLFLKSMDQKLKIHSFLLCSTSDLQFPVVLNKNTSCFKLSQNIFTIWSQAQARILWAMSIVISWNVPKDSVTRFCTFEFWKGAGRKLILQLIWILGTNIFISSKASRTRSHLLLFQHELVFQSPITSL